MSALRTLLFALTAGTLPVAAQIFADFDVGASSELSFTVQLDIQTNISDTAAAPRLVANFIRLAEGSAPWIDESTGVVHEEPFFDGLDFYRLAAGAKVYFGSRTNTGTDGPGYLIQDDFRSDVSPLYALYMDNDGPNTNGSRYFICAVNNPGINANYSKLGTVLTNSPIPFPGQAGRLNVYNISLGGTDESINSVTIRRVGAVALAFDEHSWNLPQIAATPLKIVRAGGTFRLQWAEQPGSAVLYYGTFDFTNWIGPFHGFDAPGATVLGVDLSNEMMFIPKAFYRGAGVTYPIVPTAQIPFPNHVLHTFHPTYGQIAYYFDSSGLNGAWNQIGTGAVGSFTLLSQTTDGPFRTVLEITGVGALHFRYVLDFDLDYSDNGILSPSPLSGGEIEFTGPGGGSRQTNSFTGQWQYL